tara:strand:- start:38 stop:178 length:141 start_codon:yes stop_codon:yes gene_type:complete
MITKHKRAYTTIKVKGKREGGSITFAKDFHAALQERAALCKKRIYI